MRFLRFIFPHNCKSSLDEGFAKYCSISLDETFFNALGFHCGLLSLSTKTVMKRIERSFQAKKKNEFELYQHEHLRKNHDHSLHVEPFDIP